MKGIDVLARALGIKVTFFESTAAERAAGKENGWFDKASNTIYLDVNAGSKNTVLFTAAHEMTHFIAK